MLSLLNNTILILCNQAPDPPVSSVAKDQPSRGEGREGVIPLGYSYAALCLCSENGSSL